MEGSPAVFQSLLSVWYKCMWLGSEQWPEQQANSRAGAALAFHPSISVPPANWRQLCPLEFPSGGGGGRTLPSVTWEGRGHSSLVLL